MNNDNAMPWSSSEGAPVADPARHEVAANQPVQAGPPARPNGFPSGHMFGGQFQVLRLLGKGGMALVYQVLDLITYEHVALKIIRPDCLTNPMARACLVNELTLSRKLRHPEVVAVYDVRRDDLQLYFTMEYIDGITLLDRLKRHGSMSLPQAIRVMRSLCSALEHAHATMVHCDVSLENIMIGQDGVKLLDFGISKALHYDPPWKSALGKGSHTAPEQRIDALSVDARADIYSLGVVFFELLTKRTIPTPLEGKFRYPGVSKACCAVVERSVVHLSRRFPTVADFREALDQCLPPDGDMEHTRPAWPVPAPPHSPAHIVEFPGRSRTT